MTTADRVDAFRASWLLLAALSISIAIAFPALGSSRGEDIAWAVFDVLLVAMASGFVQHLVDRKRTFLLTWEPQLSVLLPTAAVALVVIAQRVAPPSEVSHLTGTSVPFLTASVTLLSITVALTLFHFNAVSQRYSRLLTRGVLLSPALWLLIAFALSAIALSTFYALYPPRALLEVFVLISLGLAALGALGAYVLGAPSDFSPRTLVNRLLAKSPPEDSFSRWLSSDVVNSTLQGLAAVVRSGEGGAWWLVKFLAESAKRQRDWMIRAMEFPDERSVLLDVDTWNIETDVPWVLQQIADNLAMALKPPRDQFDWSEGEAIDLLWAVAGPWIYNFGDQLERIAAWTEWGDQVAKIRSLAAPPRTIHGALPLDAIRESVRSIPFDEEGNGLESYAAGCFAFVLGEVERGLAAREISPWTAVHALNLLRELRETALGLIFPLKARFRVVDAKVRVIAAGDPAAQKIAEGPDR
jgi:hypothetical protein